jgi:hypothetical protein
MSNSNNFPVNRTVINYIHARNYFPNDEVHQLRPLVQDVKWSPKKFGEEMDHFNLIFPDIDIILGKMVGDLVEIDRPNSGTLRRTLHEVIHFEDFEDLNDWRFVVAVEDNVFQTYIHRSGYNSVLDYIKDQENEERPLLDYSQIDDWEVETKIIMKPNDVLFFRPWIFHSFQRGILHYYKLKVI